jgi:hypothetical protein
MLNELLDGLEVGGLREATRGYDAMALLLMLRWKN